MVSIVLATYNGSKFISDQINSIMAQSYKDIELIIVDDCSHDNTIGIIKEILKKNEFINYRVIQNKSNIGPTKSFEIGTLECKGEYVAICDQDDIWYEEKITTYLEQAKNSHADIIYSPSRILKHQRITNSIFPSPQDFKTSFGMLLHNNARGATMMVKKDFVQNIVPFSDLYDKWIYFIGCLYGNMAFIDKPLQLYRIHENNYNAGRFNFRSKENLLSKLNINLEFYHRLSAFVQCNKNVNKPFSYKNILDNISNIIKFHEEVVYCLSSKNFITRIKKYSKNVLGKEFTTIEKLIYFYYFALKIR
jgi:glycosyltransferase involved in cell wall biosynthesis